MTWTDDTRTSSRSLGNFNRMVQACDYVASGQRGVDFAECVTATNPASVTSAGPISLKDPRNDPI